MFKKSLFYIHWLCGITVGLVLSIIGVTGATLSYQQEIIRWINHDSFVVNPENRPVLSPAEIYQHFIHEQPDVKVNSVTVHSSPTEAAIVNIAQEGKKHGVDIMLNPYTAAQLPEVQGIDFFKGIEQFHRGFVLGTAGRQIVGVCVALLLFFVLSGIYLRWPSKHSFKQWLVPNTKLRGRNFLWNLHAVVGTWVAVFYLVFATTGLTWSYSWWKNGFYTVMGVEVPSQKTKNSVQNQTEGAELSESEIVRLLQQTWDSVPQKLGRAYSSFSITIPKTQQTVDIAFFDEQPQHERARNTATYQVTSDTFVNRNIYADKKLGEKIVASIYPIHDGSFFGGFYRFLATIAALLMPLFFVTGWLLYLKRRQQNIQTQKVRQELDNKALAADNTSAWTIFFATQTGTAEQLAYDTARQLSQANIACRVLALHESRAAELTSLEKALFIVSTYGAGDAPDAALGFVKHQLTQQPDLSKLQYAVLALGSKDYAETFCGFGIRLNQWLLQNRAIPLFDMIKVSNAEQASIVQWYQALASLTGKALKANVPQKQFTRWQLVERQQMNKGSLGAPVFLVSLKPQEQQGWAAGDIVEVQCGNSQARLQQFVQQYHLSHNEETFSALCYKDLSRVPEGWSRQIDDLPLLPTREYSIASLPQEGVLQLLIRQKQCGDELGLGSGWMTQYAPLHQQMQLYVRRNPSFHLVDSAAPAIFIANGTGLASILSLMKQRYANHQKMNWLLFGERQRQCDFLCESQIVQWQKEGFLSFVDCAFSRDQDSKCYVQDKLIQQAERLQQWLNQGAIIYVCGSLKGMAAGVDKALRQILGDDKVDELLAQQRYKRDVY